MDRRTRRLPSPATRGFTLVEALIVVVLLAVIARMLVPSVDALADHRLEVAAGEAREALRFARAEAMRRQKPVLLDAESSAGRLKVFETSCTSFGTPKAVIDPRTKRSLDIYVASGPFTNGVSVTPRFMAAGTAWGGVIFDAAGVASDACQVTGMNSKGTPEAGSGIVLTSGGRQLTVALDPATGRVTGP